MIGTLNPNTLLPITAMSSRRNFCTASVQIVVPPTSLYEVLRVNKTASRIEIKAAYRDLAKVYHPDLSQSDGRDFIEINEAYLTLSDPKARAVYDMKIESRPRVGVTATAGFYRRWETDQCW